ncbi:restriction endonuclease subunit S [Acinetobacter sp. YH01024]|uniref:restriction endonuclease subunit S n=1 Tax=Acinetobacter sp. YH01024 TaxID=2601037 RepID=UPI0015D15121
MNDTSNFISGFGIIPNDWSCKTANEICTKISKGTTPPKSEISNEGKIPFLRVNNLTFYGRLALDSDFIFVSKQSHENFLSRSMAFPNDILMNIVGPPLGKTALLDDSYPEYNMNQAIVFYRLQKNLVDSKYFLEFLNSFKAQQWLQSRSKKTSGQQNLTIEICKDLPIILPPLIEQKAIAQILSTWDQAISATEKMLENSQQQKKALMQQLLTGKKRLLDENGVRFRGEWKSTKVKEIFKPEVLSAGNQDFPIFSVTKNGLVNQSEYFNKSVASEDTSKYRVVKTGRFVMSGLNFWMGSVDVHLMDFPVIVSPAYKVFVITNLSSPEFMKHFIRSSLFQKVLEAASVVGASVVRRNFSESIFNSYELFIPEIAEQEKIAAVLSAADQEIEGLQKKLDCLKQEKKALMQQLLTGKKRVKVAA